MSNEKHPIRNGIAVIVVGGLILAAVIWLIPVVGKALLSVLGWLWRQMGSRLVVARWLLMFLMVIVPVTLLGLLRWWRARKQPDWTEYTQDDFFDIVWRWRYSYDSSTPTDVEPFCPKDGTRLVYWVDMREFRCETCGRKFEVREAQDMRHMRGMVERQIRRKLDTGEWKRVLLSERERSEESPRES